MPAKQKKKRLFNDGYIRAAQQARGNLQCGGTHEAAAADVTQHMDHEYFNTSSNKTALTACCVFLINFAVTTAIIIIILQSSFLPAARAKYTCHNLRSSLNEALLHTIKKLSEHFANKFFIFLPIINAFSSSSSSPSSSLKTCPCSLLLSPSAAPAEPI